MIVNPQKQILYAVGQCASCTLLQNCIIALLQHLLQISQHILRLVVICLTHQLLDIGDLLRQPLRKLFIPIILVLTL